MNELPASVIYAIYAVSSGVTFSLVCAGVSYIIDSVRNYIYYTSEDESDA